jgi:hypothetical protein
MWAYDENDEDSWTQEERDSKYLRDNPGLESSLWAEWVGVVCGWDKIPLPTSEEWAVLKSNFYHGKAPIDSVAELKKMRERNIKCHTLNSN